MTIQPQNVLFIQRLYGKSEIMVLNTIISHYFISITTKRSLKDLRNYDEVAFHQTLDKFHDLE